MGCDETIGVQHELCRHSKPPRPCALCHGDALQMSEMGWHMPNRSRAKICETIMSHGARHAAVCTTHTTRRAARSCGVCKDATRETTTPPPPTCIELHLCHAMGWVGETISHLRRTSSRPFRVAAPDLGCNETIGVEHELHRHSKPPQACAVCHGGAL